MRQGVIEIEAPAASDGTSNNQLSAVECGVARIHPGFQSGVLKCEERVAAENADARSIQETNTIHFVQSIKIACRIFSVGRVEIICGRAPRKIEVRFFRENVLNVWNLRNERR